MFANIKNRNYMQIPIYNFSDYNKGLVVIYKLFCMFQSVEHKRRCARLGKDLLFIIFQSKKNIYYNNKNYSPINVHYNIEETKKIISLM